MRRLAILLVLLGTASLLGAAKKTGLTGAVTDSAGEPLAGVEVVVSDSRSGAQARKTTDSEGRFDLLIDEPGPGYLVRLSREGFRPFEHPVELAAGKILDTSWILLREEEARARDAETARIEARNLATEFYNEAVGLYNDKDFDGAVARFAEALATDGTYDSALAGLTRAHLHRRDFAAALDAAERYRGLRPDDSAGTRRLYDALWGLGETERASRVLDELAAAEPGPEVAARIFNQAAAAVATDDLETAKAAFERALGMDATLHQAALTLAQIHESEEDFAPALERIDQFLEAQPTDLKGLMLRHRALRALGRDEQAAAVLAELRAVAPDAAVGAFHGRGVELFDRGSTEDALDAFEAALTVVPDHARSHYMRGMCLVSLGRNDDARRALRRFLELSPNDPEGGTARDMLSYLDK